MLTRADLSELNRRVNAMRTGTVGAGRAAVSELGYIVAGQAVAFTQRAGVLDTGRYLRGWQRSQNTFARLAGRSPQPEQPLRPSRYVGQNLDRMRKQVSYWEDIERRWKLRLKAVEEHPRHRLWPSYQRLLRTVSKIERILGRARATLGVYQSSDGTAVVIGGRRTKNAISYSRLVSLRSGEYGGSGTILRTAGRWWARASNLEPHARLVEWGIQKVAKDQQTGQQVSTRVRARRIAADTQRSVRRIAAHPDSAVRRAFADHIKAAGLRRAV